MCFEAQKKKEFVKLTSNSHAADLTIQGYSACAEFGNLYWVPMIESSTMIVNPQN